MKKLMFLLLCMFLLFSVEAYAIVINEFVANHTGTDTYEFIEVYGNPSTDYSNYYILEIEGDGTGAGIIDGVWNVGTTDVNGFWSTGFQYNEIENGTMTLLLVTNFTGSVGADIDGDNNGSIDMGLWTLLTDNVGVFDGGSGDQNYWLPSNVLTAGFDGNPYTPGGASRIPNGIDTDSVSDWVRNDFDGSGLPGFPDGPMEGFAINTPSAFNTTAPIPEPATMLLLGSGLAGLAGLRRKFRKP